MQWAPPHNQAIAQRDPALSWTTPCSAVNTLRSPSPLSRSPPLTPTNKVAQVIRRPPNIQLADQSATSANMATLVPTSSVPLPLPSSPVQRTQWNPAVTPTVSPLLQHRKLVAYGQSQLDADPTLSSSVPAWKAVHMRFDGSSTTIAPSSPAESNYFSATPTGSWELDGRYHSGATLEDQRLASKGKTVQLEKRFVIPSSLEVPPPTPPYPRAAPDWTRGGEAEASGQNGQSGRQGIVLQVPVAVGASAAPGAPSTGAASPMKQQQQQQQQQQRQQLLA
eukprot:TRINITY_DN9341_c1_g4_i1.p1 TRINITY_DN9341_c1_g4~~TRINITY_DN9341_c1_g4_i1.p1  ORF type:complete len:279 (-),score=49.68 TRINITY_DN9341_c1_g4_i1:146-982(-)